MGSSHLWSMYDSPPRNSKDLIGKTFKHDVHDVEVVILECYPLVPYITGKAVKGVNINIPSMSCPGFVVQLVSGELAGHTYMIGSGEFLGAFTEKVTC